MKTGFPLHWNASGKNNSSLFKKDKVKMENMTARRIFHKYKIIEIFVLAGFGVFFRIIYLGFNFWVFVSSINLFFLFLYSSFVHHSAPKYPSSIPCLLIAWVIFLPCIATNAIELTKSHLLFLYYKKDLKSCREISWQQGKFLFKGEEFL